MSRKLNKKDFFEEAVKLLKKYNEGFKPRKVEEDMWMPVVDPMYGPAKSTLNYLGAFVVVIVIYIIYKIMKKK